MAGKINREYHVTGMSCTSCAANIEKTVSALPFVKEAKVNFADKILIVEVDSKKDDELIYKAVKEKGFELSSPEDALALEEKHLRKERKRLIYAWIITLPLSVKMLLHMVWKIHILSGAPGLITDIVLSFIVIFLIGFPVIKVTARSIVSRDFNMDSLIGIGASAAFISGVLALAGLDIQSFASSGAMIMSINFIGNYLKLMATGKAGKAIKELMELGAKTAFVILDSGEIREKAIEVLKIGDRVLVKPGEKIPVDGEILQGETSIDESIATGESMPVDKGPGDKVIGGTINFQGAIQIRVEKLGSDTFLSRIISMVREAQGSKVPIQAVADRVTGIFVPVILIISLGTLIFWLIFGEAGSTRVSFALYAAIAALVIACPCALGLSTPTALMVGMGMGALNGVLIRNGESIQTAKSLDVIVFDKTGTITKGSPVAEEFYTSISENEFLRLSASLEKHSEHPLAKAVTAMAESKGVALVEPSDFKAIVGKGLSGTVDGSIIEIGRVNDYSSFIKESEEALGRGKTVIGVKIDGVESGIFIISDEIKADSAEAIKELHNMGLETLMLTGDNRKAALSIAESAGIERVEAELLPHEKIEIVKRLQDEGKLVAMVGDGINDAPALKQANIGIALGTGTDIAMEAGDITLVNGSLTGVVKAINLSRETFKKIKQNLFWAFFYNVIAIPLAVSGMLHPAVAEIAMALSSINVVLNSLRLRRVKI